MPENSPAVIDLHRRFLDGFGSDAALATSLSLRRQTVYQWRQRGIAWHWRARLAAMAKERGLTIPDGFFSYDYEPDNAGAPQ